MYVTVSFLYCYVYHTGKDAIDFIINVLKHGKYMSFIKDDKDRDINIIKKEIAKQYSYIPNLNLDDIIISITKISYDKYPYYYNDNDNNNDKSNNIYDFFYINI